MPKKLPQILFYSLVGEGADGSIIKNNDAVIGIQLEVSNYFQKRSHFTKYEREMDQQKEMPVQTYAVKQKDPMAEEVS